MPGRMSELYTYVSLVPKPHFATRQDNFGNIPLTQEPQSRLLNSLLASPYSVLFLFGMLVDNVCMQSRKNSNFLLKPPICYIIAGPRQHVLLRI